MRTPNEMAILTIQKCASQIQRKKDIWDFDFKQNSYTKWALGEMIRLLKRNPTTPPLILLEDFVEKMKYYECINSKTSYIFACAKDSAEWVIDALIS